MALDQVKKASAFLFCHSLLVFKLYSSFNNTLGTIELFKIGNWPVFDLHNCNYCIEK